MQQTRTAIGVAVGARYVLVGPRPDAPDTEWDALDTLLHRPVIVAWAPSSAERPDGPTLDGLDGDPTMAMPVPVTDGRRILDGGVHDGQAYLVLELQHEPGAVPAPRPWRSASPALGRDDPDATGPMPAGLLADGHETSDGAGLDDAFDGGFDDTTVVGLGAVAASAGAGSRTTEPVAAVPVPAETIASGAPGMLVHDDADATTVLAPVDRDGLTGSAGATGAVAVAAGPASYDAPADARRARRRRPVAAIVLALVGLAALVFAGSLIIGSRNATDTLVPDQSTAGDSATTVAPATAPTTAVTLSPALTPTTRAAPRPTPAPTTTAAPETTEPAPTTTEAPPPTTAAPTVPPPTAPPTTTPPTTRLVTTLPPTTPPTTAAPAGSPTSVAGGAGA